jgi:hypothetical protein
MLFHPRLRSTCCINRPTSGTTGNQEGYDKDISSGPPADGVWCDHDCAKNAAPPCRNHAQNLHLSITSLSESMSVTPLAETAQSQAFECGW